MPAAVKAVDETYYQGDDDKQDGVGNQLVERRYHYQEANQQLQCGLKYADVCKGRHAFVGDDAGVVGNAYKIDAEHQQRAIQHPVGRRHPVCRDVHLRVKEPAAYRCAQYHYQERQPQLDIDTRREDAPQPLDVAATQLKSDEPADGVRQRAREQREHGCHSANHIVYSIVLHAQCIQYDAARVERYRHDEQRAEIEQQRVLGYTAVVRRIVKHKYAVEIYNSTILFCGSDNLSLDKKQNVSVPIIPLASLKTYPSKLFSSKTALKAIPFSKSVRH